MIKKCVRCGKEFDAHRFNVKYCDDCRPIVKREQNRESRRRWLKANPEKQRECARRWKKAHPEKNREYKRRQRENAKRKLIREILSAKGVKRT